MTSQTLYTAVNDFIEPKLKQVAQEIAALRNKGSARSREEDKIVEKLPLGLKAGDISIKPVSEVFQ